MKEGALHELPGGWVWTKMGDIISVHSGEGLTTYQMDQSGIFPVYGGNGITGYHNKFMFEESKLIIGRVGAKCGIVHNTSSKCWITDNALIVDSWLIDTNFLFHVLRNLNLNLFSVSTAQPVISSRKIYPISFGMPPLPEQRAIVFKIEQLFSDLDNGIENFKKAQAQLKLYRQSVLKAACEGKLVQTEAELARAEGREYEKADVLLARILKERREKRNGKGKFKEAVVLDTNELPTLPEGWGRTTIGAVSEIIMGQSPPGESYNLTGLGVALINGPVEFGPNPFSKTIKAKFTTAPTKMCKENDLILCVRGSTTGRMNISGFDACIGRGVAAIKGFINQWYLNYYIHFNQKNFLGMGTGTTFPNISSNQIAEYSIPLPPLAEQHRIVAEVERRLSVCDKMEATITESLQKAESLRQSILKKAFEGKLLNKKELEKARNAPDWEPAEKLLERIKAEKMNIKTTNKDKK